MKCYFNKMTNQLIVVGDVKASSVYITGNDDPKERAEFVHSQLDMENPAVSVCPPLKLDEPPEQVPASNDIDPELDKQLSDPAKEESQA